MGERLLVFFLVGGCGRGARLVGAGLRLVAVRWPEDLGGAVVLRVVDTLVFAAARLAPDLPAPAAGRAMRSVRGVAARAAVLPAAAFRGLAFCFGAEAFPALVRPGAALLVEARFTVDFLSLLTVALRAAGRAAAAALRATGLRTGAFFATAFRPATFRALPLRATAPVLARLEAFFVTVRATGVAFDAAAPERLDLAALLLATVSTPHVTTVIFLRAATDGSLSVGGQLL